MKKPCCCKESKYAVRFLGAVLSCIGPCNRKDCSGFCLFPERFRFELHEIIRAVFKMNSKSINGLMAMFFINKQSAVGLLELCLNDTLVQFCQLLFYGFDFCFGISLFLAFVLDNLCRGAIDKLLVGKFFHHGCQEALGIC